MMCVGVWHALLVGLLCGWVLCANEYALCLGVLDEQICCVTDYGPVCCVALVFSVTGSCMCLGVLCVGAVGVLC